MISVMRNFGVCVVLLASWILPTISIYSSERLMSAVEELRNLPILQNSELNSLKLKDLFVLANQEIPEAYVGTDGTSSIAMTDSPAISEDEKTQIQKVQSIAATVADSLSAVQATPSPPSHIGLDSTCSDKLCDMMEYLLSCKALNLGVRKRCAKYLLGSFYGCSQFPNYEDSIYDAPSVCLEEYITLLMTIASGVKGLSNTFQTEIATYLLANFSTNACERRCYQRYQTFSNDFYLNCASQVAQFNKSYPIPAALSIFQPFRNQACAKNTVNDSCYVQISTTFAEIQFLNKTIYHGDLNLPAISSDYTCNYFGLNSTYYNQTKVDETTKVFQKSCGILTNAGCCAGTGISIVQLNQIESLKGKFVIFPPCFLNYMRLSCPTAHLNEMCPRGSTADQVTIQGNFTLPKSSNYFPNVYVQQSLLYTQGAITNALSKFGYQKQPYNFNAKYPFQVYLIGYAYFASDGTQLTPADGTPAWPRGSDYAGAATGTFYYQVVMQNVNSTQAASVQNFLVSGTFRQVLAQAYGVSSVASVTAAIYEEAQVFEAEPNSLPSSSEKRYATWQFFSLGMIILMSSQLLTSRFA